MVTMAVKNLQLNFGMFFIFSSPRGGVFAADSHFADAQNWKCCRSTQTKNENKCYYAKCCSEWMEKKSWMSYISSADTSRFRAYHSLPHGWDLQKNFQVILQNLFKSRSIDLDEKHFLWCCCCLVAALLMVVVLMKNARM